LAREAHANNNNNLANNGKVAISRNTNKKEEKFLDPDHHKNIINYWFLKIHPQYFE